jgi:hypothetical protein
MVQARGNSPSNPPNATGIGAGNPHSADESISPVMIRKIRSGGYRLYSRKPNPVTGKRRNLGTFSTLQAAKRHERAVQYFKRH